LIRGATYGQAGTGEAVTERAPARRRGAPAVRTNLEGGMIRLDEPYRKRPIRPLGLWTIDSWRMKAYGIAYDRETPASELTEAAYRLAGARLQESAAGTAHYGVGFVGIHQGKTGNFVFIDWWADENELHHHVYVSPAERADRLEYVTPTGLAACVWDLRVLSFERDAWVEHILRKHPQPDVEAYLGSVLDTEE
jgi:hypothetical protein